MGREVLLPWWFDGDRSAAQEAFTHRGTVSLQAFKAQMAAIEREWPHIDRPHYRDESERIPIMARSL
jgi:hypothetical protein